MNKERKNRKRRKQRKSPNLQIHSLPSFWQRISSPLCIFNFHSHFPTHFPSKPLLPTKILSFPSFSFSLPRSNKKKNPSFNQEKLSHSHWVLQFIRRALRLKLASLRSTRHGRRNLQSASLFNRRLRVLRLPVGADSRRRALAAGDPVTFPSSRRRSESVRWGSAGAVVPREVLQDGPGLRRGRRDLLVRVHGSGMCGREGCEVGVL